MTQTSMFDLPAPDPDEAPAREHEDGTPLTRDEIKARNLDRMIRDYERLYGPLPTLGG